MSTPPFSNLYQDVYFSAQGGLDEKRHVFMGGNNLPARFANRSDFVIFEAGFGTGLSALATAAEFLKVTDTGQHLHIWSVEGHPLAAVDLAAALAPWSAQLDHLDADLVRAYPPLLPGTYTLTLRGRVHITLMFQDLSSALPDLDLPVDAWYLDGFTPAKNPAMWSDDLFNAMAGLSATGATAATYSAARVVKDGLVRAGFAVQKQKGFGYKSDMLTATYTGTGRPPLSMRRHARVLIYGGGMAGCAAAHALKNAGLTPVIVAPGGLADAASGNLRGLYNPRFSAGLSPSALFYRMAFTRFSAFLKTQDPATTGHIQNGALHLIRDEASHKKLTGFLSSWGWPASAAALVTADQASDIAGLPVPYPGVFLPNAGSVRPPAMCALYASGVEVRPDDPGPHGFDAILIAQGATAAHHPACAHLNLQAVRGQVSIMAATSVSAALRTNLCYGGYITAAFEGQHVLGSTFQHWLSDTSVRDEDHLYVQNLLHQITGPIFSPQDIIGGRAGFRVTTPDRLPVIGDMPLGQQSPCPTYISGAHGSHGLISSYLGGLYLAEQIMGGPCTLPAAARAAVNPRRFIDKSLKNAGKAAKNNPIRPAQPL